MKIKFLIICAYFLLSINSYSQKKISSGEINYEITMKFDQEKLKALYKKNKASGQVIKMLNATAKDPGKANFTLLFNTNASTFKEDKYLKTNDKKFNLVKILSGGGSYYTNKTTKKILNQSESFGEVFLIELPPIKWILTQERKKIGKYTCYKATTTKLVENRKGITTNNIIAWYAPKINVNYGPQEYGGLPGLILELRQGNLQCLATEIALNLKENVVCKQPTRGKKVTLEEHKKIMKDLDSKFRRN
jgi:GLPGLI family protein